LQLLLHLVLQLLLLLLLEQLAVLQTEL